MLPSLNADAEAINKLAQKIAHEHEQEYVGTEHILLAVVQQPNCLAARVLLNLGVSADKAKAVVDSLLDKAKEDTWVFGRLPGSPHFRNVIANAIEEAKQLESKSVGSEHLLLGLLRERGCMAEKALHKLGITIAKVRDEVVKNLSA